jgi:hypothetical protein
MTGTSENPASAENSFLLVIVPAESLVPISAERNALSIHVFFPVIMITLVRVSTILPVRVSITSTVAYQVPVVSWSVGY